MFYRALFFLAVFLFGALAHAQVNYTPLFDNTSFTKVVDVSKPVGVVDGAAGVSPTGGATYTIPIKCPPGSGGVVPNISIVYNSQGGNGILGQGWNIGGLSAITRVGKDMYHDNVVAPVNYTYDDKFALDGNRLNSSGNYGHDQCTYRLEADNFSQITSYGDFGNGPSWFRVWMKDGTVMDYGLSTGSKFLTEDQQHVLQWKLSRITDINGNYIEFVYWTPPGTGISVLNEVKYTGNTVTGLQPYNKIEFNYANRSDVNTLYEGGSAIIQNYLLDKITVEGDEGYFKTYQFNYGFNDISSFLKEVVEEDANGVSLNSTIFKYGEVSGNTINSFPLGTSVEPRDAITGDYNGDGLTDVILGGGIGGYHTGFAIYENISNDQFQLTKTIPLLNSITDRSIIEDPISRNALNTYLFRSEDFQGDGYDDLVVTNVHVLEIFGTVRDVTLTDISIYSGSEDLSSFDVSYTLLPAPNYGRLPKDKPFIFSGDFDGDGRTDLLTLQSNSPDPYNPPDDFHLFSYSLPITTPQEVTGFNYAGNPINTISNIFESIFVIDLDGDGKNELAVIEEEETCVFSFSRQQNGSYTATLIRSGQYPTRYHHVYVGDFNGDHKTDLLTGNDSDVWEIAYSTGKDFLLQPFSFQTTPDFDLDDILIADYNGDGRTDILRTRKCGYDCEGFEVYYSSGTNFKYEPASSWFSDMDRFGIGDFNGDGKSDVFFSFRSPPVAGSFWTYEQSILHFKTNSKENYLNKILDGFGKETTFIFSNLSSGGSFYQNDLSSSYYPLNHIRPAINVVSSMMISDGIGGQNATSYRYEDAMLHRAGKGFLGFKKIVAENTTSHIKTETVSDINTSYYVPYAKETNTWLTTTNTQLSHKTFDISFQATVGQSYFQKLNGSTEQNLLTGATGTISNTYDSYGNITQGTAVVNNIETTVTNTSYEIKNTPCPARPSTIQVTRTRSGNASVQEGIMNVYDPKGRLQMTTSNTFLPLKTTKTYGYDDYGNILNETVTGTSIPGASVSSYTYDSRGRFPVSATNPLSQTAYTTWDPLWGKPLTETGIDGLVTTNHYDSWGRLTSMDLPEGTITYLQGWGNISNGEYWYTQIVHPERPDVKTYYDILSREVRTETEHFAGQWTTATTTYNSAGQAATTTRPHLPSETPFTTSYAYNDLQQVETVINPYGTTSYSYSYGSGNSTVSVTNPAGQSSSSVTDATGKVVQSSDNGGVLRYTYDSRGNRLLTKHGLMLLISNSYDSYGRKSQMWDSDAGTTLYTYDAWGRLLTEEDANGAIHSYVYDVMGKVVQRIGPEGTTTYSYSTAADASINQLTSIAGFNGVNETFSYDGLGRLDYKQKNIAGNTYATTYTYTNWGDVEEVHYTDGFSYANVYDNNGFLLEVKTPASSGTTTLFSANAVNGNGQYTSYTLGNGITTTKTYDYDYLKDIQAAGVQDLTLAFNQQTGNLNMRRDNLKFVKEDFTYDNLNRLTSSTVTHFSYPPHADVPVTLTYDVSGGTNTMGNIKTKSDAGSYGYGVKRHAVTSVVNSQNISHLQQDITYTPFRKAATVTEDGSEERFLYDAAYSRVRTELWQGGALQRTRYYLGDYEENVSPGGMPSYVHYIPGGDGVCAIVSYTPSGFIPVSYYYVYKDHLGSILTATDATGSVVMEQNFDAWGRSRNAADWTYNSVPALSSLFYRGYTGHEHMPEFTLINMNGRMYDPVVGRMLSPDIFLHEGTQGYNRYSYAMNNPLSYVDPDGDNPIFIAMAVGAALSALTYTVEVATSPGGLDNWNWTQFTFGTFSGAITSAWTAGIGNVFGPVGSVTNEIERAAFHGAIGFVSGSMGGSGSAGFLSGALSSLAGSFGAHVPVLNTAVGSAAFAAGVGGGASAIAGGNVLEGAVQGLMVDLLNQQMHKDGKGNKFRGGKQKVRDGDLYKYPEAFQEWWKKEVHEHKKDWKLPGQPDPDLDEVYEHWKANHSKFNGPFIPGTQLTTPMINYEWWSNWYRVNVGPGPLINWKQVGNSLKYVLPVVGGVPIFAP